MIQKELTCMPDPLIHRWGVPPVVIRCVHWTMQRGLLQTWLTALGPAIIMLLKFADLSGMLNKKNSCNQCTYPATTTIRQWVNSVSRHCFISVRIPIINRRWFYFMRGIPIMVRNAIKMAPWQILTHIEGILPKGPYLPCESMASMAGRALLAGYMWRALDTAMLHENLRGNLQLIYNSISRLLGKTNYFLMQYFHICRNLQLSVKTKYSFSVKCANLNFSLSLRPNRNWPRSPALQANISRFCHDVYSDCYKSVS